MNASLEFQKKHILYCVENQNEPDCFRECLKFLSNQYQIDLTSYKKIVAVISLANSFLKSEIEVKDFKFKSSKSLYDCVNEVWAEQGKILVKKKKKPKKAVEKKEAVKVIKPLVEQSVTHDDKPTNTIKTSVVEQSTVKDDDKTFMVYEELFEKLNSLKDNEEDEVKIDEIYAFERCFFKGDYTREYISKLIVYFIVNFIIKGKEFTINSKGFMTNVRRKYFHVDGVMRRTPALFDDEMNDELNSTWIEKGKKFDSFDLERMNKIFNYDFSVHLDYKV